MTDCCVSRGRVVGGQGGANWSRLINQKDPKWDENFVAFYDVDLNRAANGFKAMPNARRFKDFRVMFDRMHKEIDAAKMKVSNHPELDVYIKEPVRKVWEYRENLWKR